jgi:hypothetical protein
MALNDSYHRAAHERARVMRSMMRSFIRPKKKSGKVIRNPTIPTVSMTHAITLFTGKIPRDGVYLDTICLADDLPGLHLVG